MGDLFEKVTHVDIQLGDHFVSLIDESCPRETLKYSTRHCFMGLKKVDPSGMFEQRTNVRYHPSLPIYCVRNTQGPVIKFFLENWATESIRSTFPQTFDKYNYSAPINVTVKSPNKKQPRLELATTKN